MKYIHHETIHNTTSAEHIVPLLLNLFSPINIIDIGCGTGTWLKVFKDFGISDITGVDGVHVDKNKLHISIDYFVEHDLEKQLIAKKYDLLICLEVAEHLSAKRAASFIEDLCKISDIIIFSAAIPLQGGQNHLNEQYPSYWINYFNNNDFKCYDLIRPKIWNNVHVDWWYRQNTLTFIKNSSKFNLISDNLIEPLISKNLYEMKIKELAFLNNEINNILNGQLSIHAYCKMLMKYLYRRYLKRFIL